MLIWPHWIRHSVPSALKVTLVSGLARSQPCVNAAPRTSTLILLRLRDALLTEDDWEHLMKQTPARVPDLTPFITALHLCPTIESVVEHNVARLHASGQPVATINAIHTGPNRKMSCPKVDIYDSAATCRSVNHTLTHREANALELALSRSRSPHNAPHSPS